MTASPKYGPRFKCKKHLVFVATHPCCVCNSYPTQAHHPLSTKSRQKLGKSHDWEAIPLCFSHHSELHDRTGKEVAFMKNYNIEFKDVWTRLCAVSPSKEVREK